VAQTYCTFVLLVPYFSQLQALPSKFLLPPQDGPGSYGSYGSHHQRPCSHLAMPRCSHVHLFLSFCGRLHDSEQECFRNSGLQAVLLKPNQLSITKHVKTLLALRKHDHGYNLAIILDAPSPLATFLASTSPLRSSIIVMKFHHGSTTSLRDGNNLNKDSDKLRASGLAK
jgi:hypothetical protein